MGESEGIQLLSCRARGWPNVVDNGVAPERCSSPKGGLPLDGGGPTRVSGSHRLQPDDATIEEVHKPRALERR
jgi:hypothetical protein